MSISNRTETVTVSTPRGEVEVARQQWRSQRAKSHWELVWVARRAGKVDWARGTSAREAIRQAILAPPGKPPRWLVEAAAAAERQLEAASAAPAPAPEPR